MENINNLNYINNVSAIYSTDEKNNGVSAAEYNFDNWDEEILNEFLELQPVSSGNKNNKKRSLSVPGDKSSEKEIEISKSTKKEIEISKSTKKIKLRSKKVKKWTDKECNLLKEKMDSLLKEKKVFSSQKQLLEAIPTLEKRTETAKRLHLTHGKCARGCGDLFSKIESALIKEDQEVVDDINSWSVNDCNIMMDQLKLLQKNQVVFKTQLKLFEAIPILKNFSSDVKRRHASDCTRGCKELYVELKPQLIKKDKKIVVKANLWSESECIFLMDQLKLLQKKNAVFKSQKALLEAIPESEKRTKNAIFSHLAQSKCSNGCKDLYSQLVSKVPKGVSWDLSRCKSLQETMNSIMVNKEESRSFQNKRELLEKIASKFDASVGSLDGHLNEKNCKNGCAPIFRELRTSKSLQVNKKN